MIENCTFNSNNVKMTMKKTLIFVNIKKQITMRKKKIVTTILIITIIINFYKLMLKQLIQKIK